LDVSLAKVLTNCSFRQRTQTDIGGQSWIRVIKGSPD